MSEDFGVSTDKVETITKIRKLDKKYGKQLTLETKKRDPFIPPSLAKKLRETLAKTRAITPTEISLKYDIRISAVKKLLSDLVKDGEMELVSSSRRIKVYKGLKSK